MLYDGMYGIPGMSDALMTVENQIWWGRREQQIVMDGHFLSTTVDAGNTPTDILRPGLMLGQVAATKKLTIWNPTATDGTQRLYGILIRDLKMQYNGTAVDRWAGFVLVGGLVKEAGILIPGETTIGLDGKNYEIMAKVALAQTGRFMLDNPLPGASFGGFQAVVTKAANYEITEADNETIFITGTGAVQFTLPSARLGLHYMIVGGVDANVTVLGTPAESLLALNQLSGYSIAASTSSQKIGAVIELFGISTTKWLCVPHVGTWTITADAPTTTTTTTTSTTTK